MNYRTLLLTAFTGVVALSSAAKPKGVYVSDELIVKLKPNQELAANLAFKSVRATVKSTVNRLGYQVIKLPKGVTPASAMTKLKRYSSFSKLDFNWKRFATIEPNDPFYTQQYAPPLMRLPQAWDRIAGNRSVIVAILDSGVDYNHPDLVNQMMPGYDFADDDNDPMDEDSHGTHVAGIAAASTNNGIGIAGNAYDVRIMPVRVLGAGGGTDAMIANGIVYAVDNGAKVINMSLGGYGSASQAMIDAVRYAVNNDVVVICAAGNDNNNNDTNQVFPGGIPEAICVGSTDSADQKSDFSNFGQTVDIAAPGSSIFSTVPPSINGGNLYDTYDGTSMASPQVAGIAALMYSYNENITEPEVRQVLESSTVDVGNWLSTGRVDAFTAVASLGTITETGIEPNGVAAVEGYIARGNEISLVNDDANILTIQAQRSTGLGLVGSVSTSYDVSGIDLDSVLSAKLTTIVSADKSTTLQMFFRNSTGAWILYKAYAVGTTPRTLTLQLTQSLLNQYASSGTLEVMFRGILPTRLKGRSTGLTHLNQGTIVVRTVVFD